MQDDGHIVKGQLHSECNENDGCGEKYEIDGTGQVVELERDEAVIIPEAFDDKCFKDSFCTRPSTYKITGTIKQISSAINSLGGGANFESGAKVWKNGRKMSQPRLTARNNRRNPPKLRAGSVVINRTNMLNPKVMTFEGTAYEIASQINSFEGNGVSLMEHGGQAGQKAIVPTATIKIGEEHYPTLRHLFDTEDQSRFSRKLFKDGGEVLSPKELEKKQKADAKELAKQIEKEAKRLKEYQELRKKDPSHTVNIATMVTSVDDKIGLFKQREQLIQWAKDPANKVKFIVAFSGGKDSVAMVLYLLFELGVPRETVELWHHEVDGKSGDLWDWKCTTSYCTAFAKAMGVKILFSYRDGGITREIFRGKDKLETPQGIYFQEKEGGEYSYRPPRGWKDDFDRKMKFPAVSQSLDTRWCSASAKIDVMKSAIANSPELKTVNAIICTGERRLESKNRSKYLEIEPYNFAHDRDIITWRPVIDWTEEKIWKLYELYGIQPHPAYELGWGRCSCQLCIFSSKDHWATNNEISPEKVKRIAEIEKEIGNTLYYKKVGARNVKVDIYEAKVNQGSSVLTKEVADRWLKEALGEFVSPIFVEEWKLPLGAYDGDDCGAN